MNREFRMTGIILLVCFLITALNMKAEAGVGENRDVNELLFGQPVKTEDVQGYAQQITYRTRIYDVVILYTNQIARVITYRLRDGELFSIERISGILEKNNAPQDYASGYNRWYFDIQDPKAPGIISFRDYRNKTTAKYNINTAILTVRLNE